MKRDLQSRAVSSDEVSAIAEMLEAMRGRMSFRLVQSELKRMGMPTALGWPPLIEKLSDIVRVETTEEVDWRAALADLYLRHIHFGPKAVNAYWAEPAVAVQLAAALKNIVEGNAFDARYPLPLKPDELVNAPMAPTPVAVSNEGESSVCLVLCSKRYYTLREQIEIEDLDQDLQKTLASFGYDQFLGIKRGVFQAFDEIVVDRSTGLVQLRIDMSRPMPTAFALEIITQIRQLLVGYASGFADHNAFEEVNFFPSIERLYKQADGRVTNLGHATGTNSIKNEKMRRGKQDLREETFHKNGLHALDGKTDCYAVSKEWAVDGQSNVPSVEIPGHVGLAGGAGSVIKYVLIDGCIDLEDFSMVMSKALPPKKNE